MQIVAHRAADVAGAMGSAAAVADALELDVHLFRGRLEVRHAKVIRPFAVHWERSGLVRDLDPPTLDHVLAAVPTDVGLWVDLKGFTTRLCERALVAVGGHRPLTLSCRSWWVLRPVSGRSDVDTYRSVGTRWQRWIAERVRHPGGVVLHERLVDERSVTRLRPRCSSIAAWAVDSVERARELERLGVDTIIVDDLDLMAALREG